MSKLISQLWVSQSEDGKRSGLRRFSQSIVSGGFCSPFLFSSMNKLSSQLLGVSIGGWHKVWAKEVFSKYRALCLLFAFSLIIYEKVSSQLLGFSIGGWHKVWA